MRRLRGLTDLLVRRRLTAAAVAVAVIAAAAIAVVAVPATWRATAMLAVEVAERPAGYGADAVIAAEVALLRDVGLHRRTVAALRRGPEVEATEALGAALTVDALDPRSIRLSLDGPDRGDAAATLNLLIELYFEQRQRLIAAADDGRREHDRLLILRRDHEEAAAKLSALRQENVTFAIDEQRPLLLRQRAQLERDLEAATAEIAGLEGSLETLREQLRRTPRSIALAIDAAPPNLVGDATAKLAELELREQELLGRYRQGSQPVQAIRDEIARIRTSLRTAEAGVASRLRSGPNPVHQELHKQVLSAEAALNAARRRQAALEYQLSGANRRIADLAAREAAVKDIEAKIQSLRQETAALSHQPNAMPGASADVLRHATVRLLRPAVALPAPVWPKPARDLPLAVLVGIVMGVAAAALADRFSGRLETVEAVERRLGLPVLATLAPRP